MSLKRLGLLALVGLLACAGPADQGSEETADTDADADADADADSDSDADADSDADTDTDTDTDSDADADTDSVATMAITEQYFDEVAGCWEERELIRPESEWGIQWTFETEANCSTISAFDCYNSELDEYVFEGDCVPTWLPYASEDGLCTRWINPEVSFEFCTLTDPWVRPCEEVEGCCDIQRAHAVASCWP